MSDKSIICEVCGQKKTTDEMSKSYKHRCKACIAEMARKNRLIDKGIHGIHASTLLIDEPKIDIATAEVRLTETAISALIKKNDGRIMQYECEEIGRQAVAIAHSSRRHPCLRCSTSIITMLSKTSTVFKTFCLQTVTTVTILK